MNSRLPPFQIPVLALFLSVAHVWGAEPPKLAYFYDEESMRYLTLRQTSATGVEVAMRWASEPGSTGMWTGQGNRKDNVTTFAAVVEEGQDRGTYFIAKGGESKMEILFKPGQKMPQDPGILGIYRRVSDEKRLQLARKEAQAAEERLNTALKESAHTWSGMDKLVPADWKARWPVLLGRWMKIGYQPLEPQQVKPAQPVTGGKETPSAEKDVNYWLKLAQARAVAYGFIQQMPVLKSSSWDGEYDDGFGGHVSIRRAKDGKLRVNLNCTRVIENQGADLAGQIPAEAVKSKNDEDTAAAVFNEADVPEDAKEVSIMLKRKGGFLWVETKRKASPPGSLSWFDGIYRWSPVPVE
ncbi:MAG: hypothetical protein K9N47_05975 [Prosthecobacter sp.]|uniref:hypothetical protein n=1 Tax=Prosthecobacter sp. TaxID=1965333 RepID=UPI0025EA7791|nr:hypothetical protein [Prosthecobacter sp.]MCF7785650.1 hypothetical protein [Prosthecobacter sp.]